VKQGWARKDIPQRVASERGPLNGKALARLQGMSTDMLVTMIDNSLSKIGKLVLDSQREGMAALLGDAEREAAALAQAISELSQRTV
jgi:hypothetical protein